jgi:U-box domain
VRVEKEAGSGKLQSCTLRQQEQGECQGLYQDDAKPGEWQKSPDALASKEYGTADHLGVPSVRVADPVGIDYSTVDAPAYMKCQISFEIMRDPVTTPNGDSYERSEINNWLRTKPTGNWLYVLSKFKFTKATNQPATTILTISDFADPITRRPLQTIDLVPNHSLKAIIEAYITMICPLSNQIMLKPVIVPQTGKMYEKSEIVKYALEHHTGEWL